MKTVSLAVATVWLAMGAAWGQTAGSVRSPAVAGAFYEGSPFGLDAQVSGLLKKAGIERRRGTLLAAVAPHAGYVFSGACAAHLYAQVASGRYERVFILGTPHHAFVSGVSLPDVALTAYATPLGQVPIDAKVCAELRKSSGFTTVPGADVREHSIEVQLPFLQKTAGAFRFIPLLCGQMSAQELDGVATALAAYAGSNTLFIASSDFTHYGPNYDFVPFSKDVPGQLRAWLKDASNRIAAQDITGFTGHLRDTGDTICGAMPIRVLLATLGKSRIPVRGEVLATATSGDIVDDYRNSVSYAAIGFFQEQKAKEAAMGIKEHRSGEWTPGLSEQEKETLFAIAADTLKWCVEGAGAKFSFEKYAITPLMKTNMATFVTLKIQGHLRGCIGSLAPVAPLYKSVHDNAINAALRDWRFTPVTPQELPKIGVDVSILSPIRDIGSIKEFKIGQQGIILEKGRDGAVYLPEVAVEQGWTVEQTLSSLSMKAGLPPDAWREGAKFKVFESVVLSR